MKRLASKKSLGLVAALALFAGSAVSCTGQFRLTQKFHKWQTGMENKWMNELVFIIPGVLCYAVTTAGDALIFNSIEFWGGNNPFNDSAPAK